MEIKNLIEVLEKQKNNIEKLFEVAEKKKRALITSNYQLLEESLTDEQNLLVNIQQAEKERMSVMTALTRALGVKIDNFRICEFVDKTNGVIEKKIAGLLLKEENYIRESVLRVQALNKQNLYLIEHSRAFIKETLLTVLKTKNVLLDKKV